MHMSNQQQSQQNTINIRNLIQQKDENENENDLENEDEEEQQKTNIYSLQQMRSDTQEVYDRTMGNDPRKKFDVLRQTSKMNKQESEIREEVIQQLQEIFEVSDLESLVNCAKKTHQVIHCIPRLENLIKQVCQIVLYNEELHNKSNQGQVEMLIPTIQLWRNQVAEFKIIKQRLLTPEVLARKENEKNESIYDSLTDAEKLVLFVERLVKERREMVQKIENLQQISQCSNLQQVEQLQGILNLGPNESVTQKMKLIFQQLSDIQKFIKICQKLLSLDEEMRDEACLTYIIRLLEKMKMSQYNDPDLIMKIQKSLKLESPAAIMPKIQHLIKMTSSSERN